MNTEQKNEILKLNKEEGLGIKSISKKLGLPTSTIALFLRESQDVSRFVSCLNCGEEITIKKGRGRRPLFCCKTCKLEYYKRTTKSKTVEATCLFCGKAYNRLSYLTESKFCSIACSNKFRHARKRLSKKSS